MGPTLVLGLGNPLQQDDGVGIRVVEALERCELPAQVEVMDGGTPGLGLINLLEGRSRVVIVDAAEMGRRPGEVVRFGLEELSLVGLSKRVSLHHSGVAEALALAEALGLELPEIVIYGVQPERIGWGEELGAQVSAALPGLVKAVIKEISDFRFNSSD